MIGSQVFVKTQRKILSSSVVLIRFHIKNIVIDQSQQPLTKHTKGNTISFLIFRIVLRSRVPDGRLVFAHTESLPLHNMQ